MSVAPGKRRGSSSSQSVSPISEQRNGSSFAQGTGIVPSAEGRAQVATARRGKPSSSMSSVWPSGTSQTSSRATPSTEMQRWATSGSAPPSARSTTITSRGASSRIATRSGVARISAAVWLTWRVVVSAAAVPSSGMTEMVRSPTASGERTSSRITFSCC